MKKNIDTRLIARGRTAKDVIDQAIKDNRFSEWLMYAFSIVFVAVGIAILFKGVQSGEAITTFSGVVAASLFWPAMTSARRIRKENIAIRLLEAPLSRADTSKEAADMLRELVDKIMSDTKKDGDNV